MTHKILIADDNKMDLTLIANMLRSSKNGFSTLSASDGESACNLASSELPDLILMDWQMPNMDGIMAVKQLKSNIHTRDIPIIMETGMASSKNLQEALDAGAMDYIKKPIDKIELIARVKSALMLHDSYSEIKRQKRRIEEQIDELNKLSLIVKQTDNAVIMTNASGDIEWANEGFIKMYGYSLDEFRQKFGPTLFTASRNPNIEEKYEELQRNQSSVSYVSLCKTKYGSSKWIQTTLTPLFDGNRIEKLVAIETDITLQKDAEIALKQQNDDMQSLLGHLEKVNSLLEKQNQEILLQKQFLEEEQKKSENLLLNILPQHVALQLKSIGYANPRNYSKATVMFTDFQGFTQACEKLSPEQVVSALHSFFAAFDDIVVNHFIEKIKTIGDAYMCAGGLPLRNRSNPFDVVLAALEIQHFMRKLRESDKGKELPNWELRIGVHTGALVAGVVGKIKFAYDIWGDTVNISKRIESACEVGKVNISEVTYAHIKDYFDCTYRGKIEMKNHGEMDMYFVLGIKQEYAEDQEHIIPNDRFREVLNNL
jgi:PAS domain S-box-containing protein